MAEITGILLAAGSGTRFGGDKLRASVGGSPLLALSARSLLPCDRIVVVVQSKSLMDAIPVDIPVECAVNPVPERGMGSSIACAVDASAGSDGWCILPADMPCVSAETTRQVVDVLKGGAPVAAPVYQGRRGHPVGFGARFADELLLLDGEQGARSILERYADLFVALDSDDAGILIDIDTRHDIGKINDVASRDGVTRQPADV
jgi:molybdenum cofactor cytidylyltransferase